MTGAAEVGASPDRRRGFYNFLTWPFLLGAAFAVDSIAAANHAAADELKFDPLQTDRSAHAPAADAAPDPVQHGDWEPGASDPSSQYLLPDQHFPDGITPGNVDYPGSPLAPEPEPLPPALGGGGGGYAAHAGDDLAGPLGHLVGPVELSNFGLGGDFSHIGISSAPLLSLGGVGMPLVQSVDGLAGGLLHDVAGIANGLLAPLGALPILGPLASGPLISPLLGEVAQSLGETPSGGEGAHAAHSAVGSAAPTTFTDAVSASTTLDVVSPGTITFAGGPFNGDLPQMFANGSFTDFGVAVQSTIAHPVTGIIDHVDAGLAQLDLGHLLDLQSLGGVFHLNDDGHLRTPLDLLG